MNLAVEKFLDEFNIRNKCVILAYSAGPDSTFLLLMLNELKEKFNLKIILAYFNHGWRKEAKKEEDFTLKIAEDFGFEAVIGRALKDKKQTEETARELRYEFLEKTAKKFSTDVVFLAHNKNDNIETLLYRVFKGTSLKGLCSIPKVRGIYYRPLLSIEKKDILNYLKEKKQDYKIDSSNNDTKYKRNLIRNEILPLIEKINPNYINNIDILIKNANNSTKIIDNIIKKIENEIIADNKIKTKEFLNLDKAYRYEILNNYLKQYLKYRDYKTISKIDDFILNNLNKRTSLNNSRFIRVKKDFIFIEKKLQNKFIQIKEDSI